MHTKFNPVTVFVTLATFFVLLYANISEASEHNKGLHRTVYELGTLQHSSPNPSKVSNSRFYGSRYYRYNSKRSFNRGSRFNRGGYSYGRSSRSFKRSNRYYRSFNGGIYKRNFYPYRYRY